MDKKWMAFDIETAQPPPNAHDGNYAIGVTCAVTQPEGQPPMRWMGNIQPDRRFALRMRPTDVCLLAIYLCNCADDDYNIVSINGAGFDFRVLAAECQHPEIEADLKCLALDHYDPCFQMLCQRGFRVGLDALARGFGLGSKTEGMDGSKAAAQWFGTREDQERVFEYCEHDARLTLDVALNMESASAMHWISMKGKRLWEPIDRPLTARECLALDLPDTSWMDDPPTRESIIDWAVGEKENES